MAILRGGDPNIFQQCADGQLARAAKLMFNNAKLRLTMPEAYEVHKSVIEWNAAFSTDKMPDQAIGLDPLATKLMKWAMVSWERVDFLNTFLAGTLLPRIQMDWLPGLFCGAHFALLAKEEPQSVDDFIVAGGAMQRFWLTAASLGLQLQPEMTPLIFSRYVRAGVAFSKQAKLRQEAGKLRSDLENLLGAGNAERAVFMGRIGDGPRARSRSLRLSLKDLMA
ncbi:MAG: hypothetical protein PHE55_13590 [Methylococcaceae bacterium]|nr:hypothetical protein [Methylococcaceae bacterium]